MKRTIDHPSRPMAADSTPVANQTLAGKRVRNAGVLFSTPVAGLAGVQVCGFEGRKGFSNAAYEE
jgi:hypothetical protein